VGKLLLEEDFDSGILIQIFNCRTYITANEEKLMTQLYHA